MRLARQAHVKNPERTSLPGKRAENPEGQPCVLKLSRKSPQSSFLTSTGWNPRPSTSCARWPASAATRCCSSPAARTRSACCASPKRHSARAAFRFPLLHVDTGHNYREVTDFRDRRARELGERLIVRSVEDSMARGTVVLKSPDEPRNKHQSVTLLEAIEEFGFDACIGGARRDEEKARAKERIFSFRDEFGQWDPKNQRPELWDLYNARSFKGENIRVFPISNWTEIDVWQYIEREHLELPSIYFAHRRPLVRRSGGLLPVTEVTTAQDPAKRSKT
jgi:3'-phosphoadenosine 5'-phosphosulfate sulfotransferase (PAPS reductase)/FAD synthetase